MHLTLQKIGAFIWELVKVVGISLAIILPIRYFLVQPFYVKGASMEPNYYDYEYLIIDELTYRFSAPQRGDVIVMRNPFNGREYFIKRIIALSGEQVTITNGQVMINGVLLDESSYLPERENTYTAGEATVTLQEDEYFVLGDNRMVSHDSRRFGPINRSEFVGRVWIRAWPFSRFAVFSSSPENGEAIQ